MKDRDGYYTVLVWVVERQYNENRGGWDYKVRQRDAAQNWLDEYHWKQEKELKKA
jgi:hypothetical protein